jgi:hypothetical protein
MPDIPDITLADYHSHGRAAIVRAKEDAIRTLQQAGLPQERILPVVRRIDAACFTLLTEQDAIIDRYLAFGDKPRSSPEHAKLTQSLVGWYIQETSKATAVIAAIEIKKALEDYQQTFTRPEPAIEGSYREPWPPDWLETLLRVTNAITRGLVWFLSICVLTLVVWAASGSFVWLGLTVGLSLLFVLYTGGHWLGVLFPLGAIIGLVVIVLER